MHHTNMTMLLATTAALLVIVVVAHLCGRLAPRIGQPVVVGEMVAGVLLGPSVLGLLAPAATAYVFPAEIKPVLFSIGMIGLSLYMFLVGIEHKHQSTTHAHASVPLTLAVAGVSLPMALGVGAAWLLTDAFKPAGVPTGVFLVFVGGALTVTAFPMLARVLQERRMLQTEFGSVAIRTAAIDDALAWCVLALVAALAIRGSTSSALLTIVPAAVFAILAYWLLPKVFRGSMERAVRAGTMGDGLLVGLLTLVLAAGWFTDYIGIYSVFGGFISGMALPRVPGFAELVNDRLLQVVRCLLLPVFFAYSGLNTDLTNAFQLEYLLALALSFGAAFVSKAAASLFVLRMFGWSWGASAAMGAMMNARGLMILIFINVGLGLGVIETRLFSILVLVAIVTTALAVPAYRLHFTPQREREAREAGTPEGHLAHSRSPAPAHPGAVIARVVVQEAVHPTGTPAQSRGTQEGECLST